MPKVVLDSTILVSAFLTSGGISRELLQEAQAGEVGICLSEEILEETQRVLLDYPRIRKRHRYTDESVLEYVGLLQVVAQMITELLDIKGIVRDPNDDMVIACAMKAKAEYIVTRDKDLLTLGFYKQIKIVSPEEFMKLLKQES